MNIQRGKLVSGGRLQIPADVRRALGLSDGDTVSMRVVDGELHVRPMRDVIAGIQQRLRDYVPDSILLSDELIADRRAAAREE